MEAAKAASTAASAAAAAAAAPAQLSHDEQIQRGQMMARLTTQLNNMKVYEDPELQAKARRIIPVKRLGEKARERADTATLCVGLSGV